MIDYAKIVRDLDDDLARDKLTNVVTTCGAAFENLLRDLYKEVRDQAPPAAMEKLMQCEKSIGKDKNYNEFGFGQMLGMYRTAGIMRMLSEKHGYKLNPSILEVLGSFTDSRNEATHRLVHPSIEDAQLMVLNLKKVLRETRRIEPARSGSSGETDVPGGGKSLAGKKARSSSLARNAGIGAACVAALVACIVGYSHLKKPAPGPVAVTAEQSAPVDPATQETGQSVAVPEPVAAVAVPADKGGSARKVPEALKTVAYAVFDEAPLPEGERKRIAVLYFDNNSNGQELDPLKTGFADMLITDLKNIQALKVVEREKLNSVLKELNFQTTKAVDQSTAQQIGKILGVEHLMMGSFFELMGQLRIDCRIVRVETGEIVKSDGVIGKKEEWMTLEGALVRKIVSGMGVKLSQGEERSIGSGTRQGSFQNLLDYSRALEEVDKGNKANAREQLEKIREFAPAKALLEKI